MNEFPQMFYQGDGAHRVVLSQREADGLGAGWSSEATDDHHARARLAAGAVDGVGAAVKSDYAAAPHHLTALRAEIERQVRAEFEQAQRSADHTNAIEQAAAIKAAAEADRQADAFDSNPRTDAVSQRRGRS